MSKHDLSLYMVFRFFVYCYCERQGSFKLLSHCERQGSFKLLSHWERQGSFKLLSHWERQGSFKLLSHWERQGSFKLLSHWGMMSSKSIVSSVYKMDAFFTEKKVTIFKLSSGETFLVKVYMTINAKML